VTWAEVEEAVAWVIWETIPGTAEFHCTDDDYRHMAQAVITKMRELRLTAVLPDG
jgi:hypothetical protein